MNTEHFLCGKGKERMEKEKLLDGAIKFAVDAHTDDRRKGTDLPYIVHPLEVLAIVATMTNDESVLAAAVLHDVVEDTKYTIENIREEFGKTVADYVAAESENKREDLPAENTWKIRKEETIQHLKKAGKPVKIITLGDKLSNLRAINRDLDTLGDALWDRFNQKDREEHGWYYKSVLDCLAEDLKDYHAFKEFEALVRKVFG